MLFRYVYLLIAASLFSQVAGAKSIITVFVHGTVDTRSREAGLLHSSDLLLAKGLIPVDPTDATILTARYQGRPLAAYHIINAFCLCSTTLSCNSSVPVKRLYYTFGWSGKLNDAERHRASKELYAALAQEYRRLHSEGEELEIELYGHSHGCTVILYGTEHAPIGMPPITRVFLSAAPLHRGLAAAILSGMFQHVVNIYSAGDSVQTLDCLSIPFGACKRTLQEIGILSGTAKVAKVACIDIAIAADTDLYYFGHNTFFTLDRFNVSRGTADCTENTARNVAWHLHPLPLVSLYPLLAESCSNQESGYEQARACLKFKQSVFIIEVQSETTIKTIPIPASFHAARASTHQQYGGQYVSEARKCMYAIREFFRDMLK